MMDGVEVGRVNVAARGCGVAWRAFELGIRYSQQRETFGKKIADHQAVLFRLRDGHQGRGSTRCDGQGSPQEGLVGSATIRRPAWPSTRLEYCSQVVEDSFRIHGGYGFSKEYGSSGSTERRRCC